MGGALACCLGVLFLSAAGSAYWPIAICCPSMGPFPVIGGVAHRPLNTLCPSLSFRLVGCANGAPGLALFHCFVSGPHRGGPLTWFLRSHLLFSLVVGRCSLGTLSPLIIVCPLQLLCASQGTCPLLLSAHSVTSTSPAPTTSCLGWLPSSRRWECYSCEVTHSQPKEDCARE